MDNAQMTVAPVSEAITNTPQQSMKAAEVDYFSYDGYQVVRGEFFAHVYEPSISFSNCKVSVNVACLRKLPTVEYIQFLINPEAQKLVVRPCSEDDKDSFLWCITKENKRKPRQITCRLFFAKLVSHMNWNPNYRYKLLGKIVRNCDNYLILFDLTASEIYQRIPQEGAKPKNVRTPLFPAEWKNQFGLPIEEHRKLTQVNIFDGYTVFRLKDGNTDAIISDNTTGMQGD